MSGMRLRNGMPETSVIVRLAGEAADDGRLAVADEDLRRRFALVDDRRVELHFVRRAVVGLRDLQVDVAVGIDRRRDREHGADVDVLHRLHATRRIVATTVCDTCTNGRDEPTLSTACLLFCAMITGSERHSTLPRSCSALIATL